MKKVSKNLRRLKSYQASSLTIGMKLEVNHKEKSEKHTNTWRLNSILLNNECVNNKIKEEIKTYYETSENENKTTQSL